MLALTLFLFFVIAVVCSSSFLIYSLGALEDPEHILYTNRQRNTAHSMHCCYL